MGVLQHVITRASDACWLARGARLGWDRTLLSKQFVSICCLVPVAVGRVGQLVASEPGCGLLRNGGRMKGTDVEYPMALARCLRKML